MRSKRRTPGIPVMPLGAAAAAYTLWSRHMQFDPADPHWFNRDRFVLSAGHGSALLYALLHLFGYALYARRPQSVPPAGQQDAGSPGVPPHRRGRGHDGPAGPRVRQRGRPGDRASADRRDLRNGGDLFDHYTYVHGRRRRHDGRRRQRGRLAGRTPPAREADLPLRRQQDLAGRSDVGDVHGRRRQALRGLRLARRSTSTKRTPTTSPRSTRRSARRKDESDRPSLDPRSTRRSASPRRAPGRSPRTASRWAPRTSPRRKRRWAGRPSRRSSSPTTCARCFNERKAAGAKAARAMGRGLRATGSAPTRSSRQAVRTRARRQAARPICRGRRSMRRTAASRRATPAAR